MKSPISKLSQNAKALHDVTIFVEDEKELLKQSSDELSADFESCNSQIVSVSKTYVFLYTNM